ncbi:hypothetical protein RRG08_062247 [Elysia crispata]|uniref:Uncharacterized protein n=1 Tax=Elysia crispata TaxID=231223 RepID=A0AAE0YG07_9GAST|nr:hypothetical protein RRG08_062247 [Elysia crispata]
MGSCVFKAGYTLYADTCIGRCIHNRFIANFQKQFGENAMHSKLTPFVFQGLLILPVPVLVNNYAYLIADLSEHIFVLVDVGDATIVDSEAVSRNNSFNNAFAKTAIHRAKHCPAKQDSEILDLCEDEKRMRNKLKGEDVAH